MPIQLAHTINWSPPPRCPVCHSGITASGRSMPLVVDGDQVYCRNHGATIEPTYLDVLREYEEWRQRRAAAIDALEMAAAPRRRAVG